jgi:6-phosphogluconolactonase
MRSLSIAKCLAALSAGMIAFTLTATGEEAGGALYTMDNAAAGNHVLAWKRMENGALAAPTLTATEGAGTGAGLSSQGSVLLSHDGHWLFVCNTGSDEISVFAVSPQGLQLADKASSGGRWPVSLALHRNLLYALNAGGLVGDKDNVAAFLFVEGKLLALPHSAQALSGDNTGPAQVSFTSDGETLVVTERTTSIIDTFSLDNNGLAEDHKMFQSAGQTPFGFAVGRRDRIFVSEAGGATSPSSASSYSVSEDAGLELISGAVPTEQNAACWLVSSHDGRFVYTGNAGSGSISGFRVGEDGSLHLLNADGRTAVIGAGSHPIDMALSRDGRFFYSLANGNGTLNAFRARHDGSLEPLSAVSGIPASAAGLAGR